MTQMKNDNASQPTKDFPKNEAAAPTAEGSSSSSSIIELFNAGQSVGYLGVNDNDWCVLVSSSSDAVEIELYNYEGTNYYRKTSDTSDYLSVSKGDHYVGFYNWHGASGWTLSKNNTVMTSDYTSNQLSMWSTDNGYVYANDGDKYTPLTIKLIPQS